MTYFLENIASHLYTEFGERPDKHCLVFPNRRAGIYFLKYLADIAGKPIWSPEIRTINELFRSFSGKCLAENELLVFELYKIYRELNPDAGTIDDFFFWGEMIVNDFDDVDKYLVDQSKLFINLENIKEIETKFGGLTEEQIDIIRQFWVNFNPGSPTGQKSSFREIWSVLLPVYSRFREKLDKLGIAYEGMIYREIAEKCIRGELLQIKWDKIHFIGFNALNSCEKYLMTFLKNKGYAKFYWDYDESFVYENPHHSAGFFIRENLKMYGNDIPAGWNYNSFRSGEAGMEGVSVIDCSSDTAQVKIASGLIEKSFADNPGDPHHTAVVLADENLLLPMLTSLPDNVASINVTMGYPFKFSPVYSFVKDLIALQSSIREDEKGVILFGYDAVINILSGSFFAGAGDIYDSLISEITSSGDLWIAESVFNEKKPLDNIFRKISSAREQSLYLKTILENLYILTDKDEEGVSVATGISIRNEFIYRVIMVINRLEAIMGNEKPEISIFTYNRLLDKILRSLSIPFSGEPLNGIQIMGLLETRSLDFRNLIMLSANEGILPQTSVSGSFIPFNLREAFGLPTIRHQDSIYSYYFYRLLQRAEHATFIYNSSSDGLRTGEKSRFLLQLEYSEKPPVFSSRRFEIMASSRVPSEIIKTQNHIDKLVKTYLEGERKTLSPSAVNTWLTCRMKFYYSYVCGLKETKMISAEIDSGVFGELLHTCMEKIYSPYTKENLDAELLGSLIKDAQKTTAIVSESINEKLYNLKKDKLSGNDLIICNILRSYIKQILTLDSRNLPLEIIEMEHWISSEGIIDCNGQQVSVRTGGYIDRLDRSRNKLRITDYKTGKIEMQIPSVESLFDGNRKDRNDTWFQLLMYCNIFSNENPDKEVRPAVYPVRSLYNDDFSEYLLIKDHKGEALILDNFINVKAIFSSGLKRTIEEIFDRETPFRMTDNVRKCAFCPYSRLCQR